MVKEAAIYRLASRRETATATATAQTRKRAFVANECAARKDKRQTKHHGAKGYCQDSFSPPAPPLPKPRSSQASDTDATFISILRHGKTLDDRHAPEGTRQSYRIAFATSRPLGIALDEVADIADGDLDWEIHACKQLTEKHPPPSETSDKVDGAGGDE